ncbi:MAG: T9SS type A sorting domain-containing protein, partial [Bacteroidales bacterium]|nr:T9SS type A sorting domain-containing protein [Bacteroidales bacterium]MBO5848990.1 T9SS type A sorting domain-containing protein [Bacteroidales bacterium]
NFNLETVNINSLSNGVYMMKVVLDNGTTFNDKIVVK